MRRNNIGRQQRSGSRYCFTLKDIGVFLVGSVLTASILLNVQFLQLPDVPLPPAATTAAEFVAASHNPTNSILNGVKILVAVVAYDFSQLPHLEEVLDGYFDLCAAGSWVDVIVFSTIAWPVSLIDILNTRFHCDNPSPNARFSITVHLKSPHTRLHLVDFHRDLFYENLENYQLFIYTEDDIRVSPRTVAAYLAETDKITKQLGPKEATNYNVGVVRYEYNFPSNMIIDDGTRQATQNVTRVYWEHSWHPPVPKSVDIIPQHDILPGYVQ
eukprot:scaffold5756_cov99-Cylindrotheca_fusiformis.AAC.1